MTIQVDPRCRYTKTHEWVRVEDGAAYVGITDFAQQQLSDIVYVELPNVGDSFAQGEVFGVIESVKAASDCYIPIGGEIVAINEELEGSPDLVNKQPYDGGWLIKFTPADLAELDGLIDAAAYAPYAEKALAEGGH